MGDKDRERGEIEEGQRETLGDGSKQGGKRERDTDRGGTQRERDGDTERERETWRQRWREKEREGQRHTGRRETGREANGTGRERERGIL